LFNNAGTLPSQAVRARPTSAAVFTNIGSVQVQSGTLRFDNGFTRSGAVGVAAGGDCSFTAAIMFLRRNADATPGGTLDYQSGNFWFNPGATVTPADQPRHRGMNSMARQICRTFELAGGGIGGVFTNTGTLNWTSGYLYGEMNIAPGGVLNLSGPAEKQFGSGNLNNSGTVNWTGGNLRAFACETYFFINNLAGGLFNVQSDGHFVGGGCWYWGAWFVFTNAGLFQKSGSATTNVLYNVTFQNQGTVEVQSGTLTFNSGFTSSGNLNVAAGATMRYRGGSFVFNSGGSLDAALGGTLDYLGGSFTFDPGATVTARTTNRIAGGISLHGTVNLPNFELAGGSLNGTWTNAGTLNWTSGYLSGVMTLLSGAVLNLSGSADKSFTDSATLNNGGTVNWTGGNLLAYNNSYYSGQAFINNQAGGVFNVACMRALLVQSAATTP
jgi:hypothetical protein